MGRSLVAYGIFALLRLPLRSDRRPKPCGRQCRNRARRYRPVTTDTILTKHYTFHELSTNDVFADIRRRSRRMSISSVFRDHIFYSIVLDSGSFLCFAVVGATTVGLSASQIPAISRTSPFPVIYALSLQQILLV
jgi:hypothetical protein